jgi:hypothetical protein
MLDAHPSLACPPETNLAAAFASLNALLPVTLGDDEQSRLAGIDAVCRRVAHDTLGEYARRRGKMRWADKSLASVNAANLLQRVFPEAQYICLTRDCADTVASLLEASPYGLQSYGLPQYAARFPSNNVMACAALWIENVTKILEFENSHTEKCYRVRYEDIVGNPSRTLEPLLLFLDLPWSERCADPSVVFGGERRAAASAGDYKVRYTTAFESSSIGRGRLIPLETWLPPAMQDRINHLQRSLGYDELGTPAAPVETKRGFAGRLPNGMRVVMAQREEPSAEPPSKIDDHAVVSLFEGRICERLATRHNSQANGQGYRGVIAVSLGPDTLPWLIDFNTAMITRSPATTDGVMRSDPATFIGIATGALNPGVAIRRGALILSLQRPKRDRRQRDKVPFGRWDRDEEVQRIYDAVLSLIVPDAQAALQVGHGTSSAYDPVAVAGQLDSLSTKSLSSLAGGSAMEHRDTRRHIG